MNCCSCQFAETNARLHDRVTASEVQQVPIIGRLENLPTECKGLTAAGVHLDSMAMALHGSPCHQRASGPCSTSVTERHALPQPPPRHLQHAFRLRAGPHLRSAHLVYQWHLADAGTLAQTGTTDACQCYWFTDPLTCMRRQTQARHGADAAPADTGAAQNLRLGGRRAELLRPAGAGAQPQPAAGARAGVPARQGAGPLQVRRTLCTCSISIWFILSKLGALLCFRILFTLASSGLTQPIVNSGNDMLKTACFAGINARLWDVQAARHPAGRIV